MSSLIVQVRQVDAVLPHNNADKLEIVQIEGWQCIVPKGQYTVNQKVIYVPPDCVIPSELAKAWGVDTYLGTGGRVKAIKLRGEPSFGIVRVCEKDLPVGTDVAEMLGITKWEPPVNNQGKAGANSTSAKPRHPLWVRYTEIEHLRNYKNAIPEGTEVVCLEKIHGHNCSICMLDGELVVGSRNLNRRPPGRTERRKLSFWKRVCQWRWKNPYDLVHIEDPTLRATDGFWYPTTIPGVIMLLETLSETHKRIQLFGECFGPIQNLSYGSPDKLQFRAFDILIDGRYVNYDTFMGYCRIANIPTCPLIYRGPYNFDKIKEAANGKTLIDPTIDQIREGVVVKPVVETNHPKVGRCVFKFISDAYTLMQHGPNALSDYKEE